MQNAHISTRVLFGIALSVAATAAFCQDSFPVRPVRFVVPYPPGGSTDPIARLIGTALTANWGQQVIVENRPGGDTRIGSAIVAKAPPDGHTILLAATTHVIIPLLYKNMPFDAYRDFAPVATLASSEKLMVVHPAIPANNLQEFIAHAKANPGKLNYATTGSGSANHLMNESLNVMAGIRTQQIPYKGAGPALTDLMGGHVQFAFSVPIAVIQHVKSGALRGIAVSGDSRLAAAPRIPTFAESGFPKFDAKTWQGIFAPAGVPRPIVNKISRDVAQILATRDVQEKFNSQGVSPFISTPEQLASLMKADSARYVKIIADANIRIE
jgi:tripartite-type tricarboxylate transporter receptor subunit TctC